ncbi:MAG: biopolymer transporter ExbD [Bacteroidota bacterium]|nr:biopolymer transporter ExbD [Bacteroidota bacterium]
MNFKRKSQPLSSFNAAPMNDILFFLLLFFLLTATFAIPTFQKVTLAKADGTQKLKQNLAIIVATGGKLYIENQEVQRADFDAKIQVLVKDKTEPVVNVIIDKGATWEDIAPITGILQKYKVNAILATQRPSK